MKHRRRDAGTLCSTCGNELPPAARVCPYCNSPQAITTPRRSATPYVTINLKLGLPTVDEAMARLDRELNAAMAGGVKVVRIIHGWGSGGKGGAIRDETRRRLKVFQRQKRVRAVAHGEDFGKGSIVGRQLPEDRSNFANPGITLVEL